MSDDPEIEALVADRYLDALLAAVDRHADDSPSHAGVDPEIREAARVLRASLVRVHPSFRFEERLAGRLADLAGAQARPALAAGGGGGAVVPFPGASPAVFDADPLVAAILAGDLDPSDAEAMDRATRQPVPRRPLIVGGAITSAAISLVGVAYVAWRASRPAGHGTGQSNRAMARAARAARARRAAAGVSALLVATASTAAAAVGTAGPGGPA
ncbi:MAG TPA: hypothetical protein VFL03_01820 [Candidatus Limnocylindrales bacterium]|nr:hypothetical protein [Candidatus Limnocylindrales bacterium]